MTPSPLFDAVFIRLRAWLLTLVPSGTPVVQGQCNRVPQPNGSGIIVTYLFDRRLRTNVNTYEDDGSSGGVKQIEKGTEFHIQLDFFGASARDWATVVETLFRDESAVTALAPECAPLHCDEGRNTTWVLGEEEYQDRVTCTAVLQWNPITAIAQEFADAASVTLVDVETLS